jgi:hypothetical protein
MGVISGNNAVMQVGRQANWSTAVAPTLQVEFTSESLQYMPNYMESDALTGARTTDRMDISGIKVEGGFDIIVNPDNIGLLLASLLGAEANAASVGGSAVYDHVFTPMSANIASSLPKLTIVVNRIVGVVGYVGVKLDSMTLNAQTQDYLRASFAARGYDETTDTVEALSASTKRPFQFVDGSLDIDTVDYADVTSFSMNYANNVENDLYTLNGSTKMQEIEPQKRDITFTLDTLYSTATDTTRTNKFKAGAKVALSLEFKSTETITTGQYYTLTIAAPNCYITEAHPNVGGPDRITMSMSLKAVETGGAPPVTITLRDGQSTKYLA